MKLNTKNVYRLSEYLEKLEDLDSFDISKIRHNKIGLMYMELFDDVLYRNSDTITFSEEEIRMYSYRPKRLSLKLYKTIDLFFILLYINKCDDNQDLDLNKPIKVLNRAGVKELLYLIDKVNRI